MSEKRGNSIKREEKANDMSDKPIPGGYKTREQFDLIKMASVEIRRYLDVTTRIEPTQSQFFQILTKISQEISRIDDSVKNLDEIFFGK